MNHRSLYRHTRTSLTVLATASVGAHAEVQEIDSSHLSPVSHPGAVADLITTAARTS
ncbi:hypothetical protein ACWDGI_12605 [Streptomyces sp. NPDC001220]